MARLALCLFVALAAGCGDITPTDARIATPERTVQTLLGAFGVRGKTPDEIRALRRTGALRLVDRESYRACFVRLQGPVDEALAGFVVGAIAENNDDLRTEIGGDTARIHTGARATLLLRRDAQGFRFDLDRSVPQDIARALRLEVQRVEQRNRHLGSPR